MQLFSCILDSDIQFQNLGVDGDGNAARLQEVFLLGHSDLSVSDTVSGYSANYRRDDSQATCNEGLPIVEQLAKAGIVEERHDCLTLAKRRKIYAVRHAPCQFQL